MKASLFAAAALAGIAQAQDFDFFAVINAPSPVVTAAPVAATAAGVFPYNPASVSASVVSEVSTTATASVTGAAATAFASSGPAVQKRQSECTPEPAGYGPQVSPDTPEAFEAFPEWHEEAQLAWSPFPYYQSFRDLNGSTQANSYITYYTLESYNVTECADYCNNIELCSAFNVYVERDPSVNPGPDCPNPPSTSVYKCALWGSSIDASSATNTGQWREDFQVVISGSNGYDKATWTLPTLSSNWTIDLNLTVNSISLGAEVFLGSKFIPGPYDPSLCVAYAEAQAGLNKQFAELVLADSYIPVNMFNALNVYKNGVAQGTYCALFDTVLSAEFANFTGEIVLGDLYNFGSSYTFARAQLDSGAF